MSIKKEILEFLDGLDYQERQAESKYREAMKIINGFSDFHDLILEIIEYSKIDTTKRFDWDFWIRRAIKAVEGYEKIK